MLILQYKYYRRYFLSIGTSTGDTFHLFFGNIRYLYFCRQLHQLSLSTTTLLWLKE